jgi:hypothetical protein
VAFNSYSQPGPPPPMNLNARHGIGGGIIIDSTTDLRLIESLRNNSFSMSLDLIINLPNIPKEFEGFTEIRYLNLICGKELNDLTGINYFPNLHSLYIKNFVGEQLSKVPFKLDSLSLIRIWSCRNLKSIDEFKKLQKVTKIEILECPSLTHFPKWAKGNQIRCLDLNNGQGFRHWDNNSKEIARLDISNLKHLTRLEEFRLMSYSCFDEVPDCLPKSVTKLSIMGKGYREGLPDDVVLKNISNLSLYPNLKEVEFFGLAIREIGGNFKGLSLKEFRCYSIFDLQNISDLFTYDSIGILQIQHCRTLKYAQPTETDCIINRLEMESVNLQDVSFLFQCTGIRELRLTEGLIEMIIPDPEKMKEIPKALLHSNGGYHLYKENGLWSIWKMERE